MTKKTFIITAGLILLSAVWLSGYGKNRELTRISADDTTLNLPQASEFETELPTSVESVSSKASQLTALADSQETAQEIADLYGIELKSYSYGVATYITDKNLREILELGLENDYPELTPDYENQLYTTQPSE